MGGISVRGTLLVIRRDPWVWRRARAREARHRGRSRRTTSMYWERRLPAGPGDEVPLKTRSVHAWAAPTSHEPAGSRRSQRARPSVAAHPLPAWCGERCAGSYRAENRRHQRVPIPQGIRCVGWIQDANDRQPPGRQSGKTERRRAAIPSAAGAPGRCSRPPPCRSARWSREVSAKKSQKDARSPTLFTSL